MSSLPRLGLHLSNHVPARSTLDRAGVAEEAGLDCVWLSEDLYHRGAFTTAGAIAARTKRIHIGLGVVTPQIRHPAAVAIEMRALLELAGPRVILGVGAGVAERTRLLGLVDTPSVRTVREAVTAVTNLLAGQTCGASGLSLTDYTPAGTPPVYVAAIGPRALDQAGQRMDGVILTMMCAHAHAEQAIARVNRAAATAGRQHPVPVVAYLPIEVDDDPAVARRRMKRRLGAYLVRWSTVAHLSRLFTDWSPLRQEELNELVRSIRAGVPAQDLVPDYLVDEYTVAGDRRDCRAALERFAAAGVTVAALDLDPEPSVARVAIEALAALRRGGR